MVLSIVPVVALAACVGDEVDPDPDEDLALRVDVIQDCGGEDCDLAAGELCCMHVMSRFGCVGDDTSGCDALLHCDGPEDCAEGERCCAVGQDGNFCRSSCPDLVVCHDHRDCEGVPGAPICRESLFVEMSYCKES